MERRGLGSGQRGANRHAQVCGAVTPARDESLDGLDFEHLPAIADVAERGLARRFIGSGLDTDQACAWTAERTYTDAIRNDLGLDQLVGRDPYAGIHGDPHPFR